MAHALLSPSSASRWLTCAPSPRLEAQFPDRAGEAAAEGSLAHRLAELQLMRALGRVSKKDYDKAIKTEIKSSPLHNAPMDEYVADYVAGILELYAAAQNECPDAVIVLERQFDLTHWVPDGFGTSDVTIISEPVLAVHDLKYGKGVEVSAEDNAQMKLYALGAYHEFGLAYDIETITMTIHQPRLGNLSTWSISVNDLLAWAEAELRPKALQAYEGAGEFAPGKACRFCKAAAMCKAQADYQLAIARHDFKAAELLSDDEVVEVLGRLDGLTAWAKAVGDYALREAVQNKRQWPGYKVVEGRSVRAISDEARAIEALRKAGYDDAHIYAAPKLNGIGAFEKLLGKKPFGELLGPFVTKPPGKPALVPESDKRPPFEAASVADFDDIE